MAVPDANTIAAEVPGHQEAEPVAEKAPLSTEEAKKIKEGILDSPEIRAVPPAYDADNSSQDKDNGSDDVIIVTGSDAAAHLLPLRDDGEPALTFRSIFLATILSGFQAVMYQIYYVSCLVHGSWLLDFERDADLSTTCVVQTNQYHDPRNLHCPHRLLLGQGLGRRPPPRGQAGRPMDGARRPRQAASADNGRQIHQPRPLEHQGACHLLHHSHLCFQRCR
jgi:hypothetical protein